MTLKNLAASYGECARYCGSDSFAIYSAKRLQTQSNHRDECTPFPAIQLNQLPPVKRAAWISPKMGEIQRRRHVSASSGPEPRAEHAVCRTIKIIFLF